MKCDEIKKLIPELLDGELEPEKAESVEDHIKSCSECQMEFLALKRVIDTLGDLGELEPPPEIIVNVNRMLDKEPFYRKILGSFSGLNLQKIPLKAVAITIIAILVVYLNHKQPATLKQFKKNTLEQHYRDIEKTEEEKKSTPHEYLKTITEKYDAVGETVPEKTSEKSEPDSLLSKTEETKKEDELKKAKPKPKIKEKVSRRKKAISKPKAKVKKTEEKAAKVQEAKSYNEEAGKRKDSSGLNMPTMFDPDLKKNREIAAAGQAGRASGEDLNEAGKGARFAAPKEAPDEPDTTLSVKAEPIPDDTLSEKALPETEYQRAKKTDTVGGGSGTVRDEKRTPESYKTSKQEVRDNIDRNVLAEEGESRPGFDKAGDFIANEYVTEDEEIEPETDASSWDNRIPQLSTKPQEIGEEGIVREQEPVVAQKPKTLPEPKTKGRDSSGSRLRLSMPSPAPKKIPPTPEITPKMKPMPEPVPPKPIAMKAAPPPPEPVPVVKEAPRTVEEQPPMSGEKRVPAHEEGYYQKDKESETGAYMETYDYYADSEAEVEEETEAPVDGDAFVADRTEAVSEPEGAEMTQRKMSRVLEEKAPKTKMGGERHNNYLEFSVQGRNIKEYKKHLLDTLKKYGGHILIVKYDMESEPGYPKSDDDMKAKPDFKTAYNAIILIPTKNYDAFVSEISKYAKFKFLREKAITIEVTDDLIEKIENITKKEQKGFLRVEIKLTIR